MSQDDVTKAGSNQAFDKKNIPDQLAGFGQNQEISQDDSVSRASNEASQLRDVTTVPDRTINTLQAATDLAPIHPTPAKVSGRMLTPAQTAQSSVTAAQSPINPPITNLNNSETGKVDFNRYTDIKNTGFYEINPLKKELVVSDKYISPPKITIESSAIAAGSKVEIVSFTEKSGLSVLTEIEISIATEDYIAVFADDLLHSVVEVTIETEHIDYLTKRANQLADRDLNFSQGEWITPGIRKVFGVITRVVEEVGETGGFLVFHLSIRPRLWQLTQQSRLRVCTHNTIPEIIEAVLKESGFIAGSDYVFKLSNTYEKKSFVIQYNETDFSFISRLTEHWGIGFFFDHRNGHDVVVFTDSDSFWEAGCVPVLPFNVSGEGVGLIDLSIERNPLPRRYILRDYNPDYPNVDWSRVGVIDGGGGGDVIEYCSHFESMHEGTMLLRARMDSIISRRLIFSGRLAEAVIDVGTVVRIVGHPTYHEQSLSVIALEQTFRAPGFLGPDRPPEFHSRFEATVSGEDVRPERRTPKPRIDGVMAGIIEVESQQQYASLDSNGCYRVRLLLDDPAANPQPYASVRMIQPHSGQGYGIHFPLRPGTEVALVFLGGDPDRPVISGTLTNAQIPSPVQSNTFMTNVIRTGGGNEINLDDNDGHQRVKISSPYDTSLIQLGSPSFPNAGITLDTWGTISERSGVGRTLLTPVVQQSTLLQANRSRNMVFESVADSFDTQWKSLFDTPQNMKVGFDNITAASRQVMDVYDNAIKTGKAQIDRFNFTINEKESRKKRLSDDWQDIRANRIDLFDKMREIEKSDCDETIMEDILNYNDEERSFVADMQKFYAADTPTFNEKYYNLIKEEFSSLKKHRESILSSIQKDPAYIKSLNNPSKSVIHNAVSSISDNADEKSNVKPNTVHNLNPKDDYRYALFEKALSSENTTDDVEKIIELTYELNSLYYKKRVIQDKYEMDTENVTKLEIAHEQGSPEVSGVATVGSVLHKIALLEAAIGNNSENTKWNTALGPLYSPILLPISSGSFLSTESLIPLENDTTGNKFVGGWSSTLTVIGSDDAMRISSEKRLLQTGKVIFINAWANEPLIPDFPKSAYLLFKKKYIDDNAAINAAKTGVGLLAGGINFFSSFLSNPVGTAMLGFSQFKGKVKPLDGTSPNSPAGTLFMRSEHRTLMTSDTRVEIGSPIIQSYALSNSSWAAEKASIGVGKRQPATDPELDLDADTFLKLEAGGEAKFWANKTLTLMRSEGAYTAASKRVATVFDDNGMLLYASDDVSIIAKVPDSQIEVKKDNINITVGDDNKISIQKDVIQVKSGDDTTVEVKKDQIGFSVSSNKITMTKDQTTIDVSENGTLTFQAGNSQVILKSTGVEIKGMQVNLSSTGSLSVKSDAAVEVSGLTATVSGSTKTTIGASGSPTAVQGQTVMLG